MTRRPTRQTKLDAVIASRLEHAATERGLSVPFLANRLIEEGLDRLVPADEFRLTRVPRPAIEHFQAAWDDYVEEMS